MCASCRRALSNSQSLSAHERGDQGAFQPWTSRGAATLILDMTATASCDHAGADAVVRAYQRAVASGTQLRLVVTAEIVRRVLSINGIDRLISIYPSVDAATAAGS